MKCKGISGVRKYRMKVLSGLVSGEDCLVNLGDCVLFLHPVKQNPLQSQVDKATRRDPLQKATNRTGQTLLDLMSLLETM